MWREEYYEFAKTPAGGSLNLTEAAAQWTAWEADLTNELRDEGGPKQSPARLWVKLGDVISFDDIQSYVRKLELVEEEMSKHIDQEHLMRMRAKIMGGMEGLAQLSGCGKVSEGLMTNAAQMLARGAKDERIASAFAEDGIDGFQLRSLAPTDLGKKDKKKEAGGNGDDGEDGEDEEHDGEDDGDDVDQQSQPGN